MRDPDKMPGDWLFKIVPIFIVVVLVAIICYWIGVAVIGVKAWDALKGCTPALVTTEKDGQKSTSIQCKK